MTTGAHHCPSASTDDRRHHTNALSSAIGGFPALARGYVTWTRDYASLSMRLS